MRDCNVFFFFLQMCLMYVSDMQRSCTLHTRWYTTTAVVLCVSRLESLVVLGFHQMQVIAINGMAM